MATPIGFPPINWKPIGVASAGGASVWAKALRALRGFITEIKYAHPPKVGRLALHLRRPLTVLKNLYLLERD